MSSIQDETQQMEGVEWTASVLSKKLKRLEMEAKALRRDVQNLEKTQNSVAVAEETEQRLMEKDPSMPSLPLTPDLLSLLVDKAGTLLLSGNKHKKMFDELNQLQAAAEHAAVKAQEAEQEYITLVELAGGDGEGVAPAAVIGLKNRDEFKHGLRELTQLYTQRELLRNQLDAQTLELAGLAEMEEATARTAEQKSEAEAALMEKLQLLSEHKLEQRRIEGSVQRADWMLQRKTVSPPLEERIRRAVFEGSIATAALEKSVEQSKMSDVAIRARATRILMAEKRLEMISETISGGLENEERVDVDTFNTVMKEVDALRVLRLEAEYQTVCLDQDIEDISYKTNAIQHITISTRSEKEKIEHSHGRYMSLVQRDLYQKQEAHEAHISALKEEIQTLRRQQLQRPATAKRSASAGASKRSGSSAATRRTGSAGVSYRSSK